MDAAESIRAWRPSFTSWSILISSTSTSTSFTESTTCIFSRSSMPLAVMETLRSKERGGIESVKLEQEKTGWKARLCLKDKKKDARLK